VKLMRSSFSRPLRTVLTLRDKKVRERFSAKGDHSLRLDQYTATAVASGPDGWNGNVSSEGMDVKFALPKHMGGTGLGTNPEQMFAIGYSGA
jgi:hypothetical protein